MKGKTQKPSASRAANGDPLKEPQAPFPEQKRDSPGLESKLEPKPRFTAGEYKAAGKLEGKVALITGGDSGIGRAVATLFAREGADVAIKYLDEEQSDAEETKKAVEEAGAKCLLLPGDVTESDTCDRLVEKTVEQFGHLDLLVSNAAYQRRKESLDDLSDEELEHTFGTNIFAYVRLSRAALRHMKPGSAIIATSSENRHPGLREAARLFGDERRHQRVHENARAIAREERDSRERRGARPRVDAAEPGRCRRAAGGRGEIRRAGPDRAPRATRGIGAGVRVPGVERRLLVHHGDGLASDGRGNVGRLSAEHYSWRTAASGSMRVAWRAGT